MKELSKKEAIKSSKIYAWCRVAEALRVVVASPSAVGLPAPCRSSLVRFCPSWLVRLFGGLR